MPHLPANTPLWTDKCHHPAGSPKNVAGRRESRRYSALQDQLAAALQARAKCGAAKHATRHQQLAQHTSSSTCAHGETELALDVCLQQPAFRQADARMIITLMRVSKRLAALVADRCGGGALAVRAHLSAPARAEALAAWLSTHGNLLAELELQLATGCPGWLAAAAEAQRSQQQHPMVRLLEQLPGNLRRLGFHSHFSNDVEPEQADALAAALSRRHMQQLCHLALPGNWRGKASTLLPALAALGQLTSLVMWTRHVGHLPLLQHLPAQLQQLELLGLSSSSAAHPWLALPHLTGLTSLSMRGTPVDGGVLARGLRALTVIDVSDMAPVTQLEQLTALQLTSCTMPADQLRQLSALRRLEQLSVTVRSLRNAAPAFGALPLVHLVANDQELTAACLDHVGACTRLARLQLHRCSLAAGVTPEQLAAMLGRLTALQQLGAYAFKLQPGAADASWAIVCRALARLPRLAEFAVSRAELGPVAAAHLAAATELTELDVQTCGLDDASVLALCSGLTGLRRLNVSTNRSLGDGCLEGIATLRQLTWLCMRGTDVTEGGLRQLRAVQPKMQLLWW